MLTIDIEKTKLRLIQLFEKNNIKPKDIVENQDIDIETLNAVYKWFNLKNKCLPSIETYIQIANLLNVSLEEMIVTKEYTD